MTTAISSIPEQRDVDVAENKRYNDIRLDGERQLFWSGGLADIVDDEATKDQGGRRLQHGEGGGKPANPDDAYVTRIKLQAIQDTVRKLGDEMVQELEQLPTYWKGPAGDAFGRAFVDISAHVKEIHEVLAPDGKRSYAQLADDMGHILDKAQQKHRIRDDNVKTQLASNLPRHIEWMETAFQNFWYYNNYYIWKPVLKWTKATLVDIGTNDFPGLIRDHYNIFMTTVWRWQAFRAGVNDQFRNGNRVGIGNFNAEYDKLYSQLSVPIPVDPYFHEPPPPEKKPDEDDKKNNPLEIKFDPPKFSPPGGGPSSGLSAPDSPGPDLPRSGVPGSGVPDLPGSGMPGGPGSGMPDLPGSPPSPGGGPLTPGVPMGNGSLSVVPGGGPLLTAPPGGVPAPGLPVPGVPTPSIPFVPGGGRSTAGQVVTGRDGVKGYDVTGNGTPDIGLDDKVLKNGDLPPGAKVLTNPDGRRVIDLNNDGIGDVDMAGTALPGGSSPVPGSHLVNGPNGIGYDVTGDGRPDFNLDGSLLPDSPLNRNLNPPGNPPENIPFVRSPDTTVTPGEQLRGPGSGNQLTPSVSGQPQTGPGGVPLPDLAANSPMMPMMPMMPHGGMGGMGGAGGQGDRERQTWLLEDDEVWLENRKASISTLGRPEDDEDDTEVDEWEAPPRKRDPKNKPQQPNNRSHDRVR